MGDEVLALGEMGQAANDLGSLALGVGAVAQATLQDAADERQRRGVEVVHELHLDERVEGFVGVLGRVAERLEEDIHQALDLGVCDDLAESLQALVGGGPDLLVAVVQDGRQGRDDLWQALSELLGVEVSHGTQGIASTLLAAPLVFLEAVEERGQDLFDTIRAQGSKASLGRRKRSIADVGVAVAKAREQLRHDLDDVRLEEAAKDSGQELVGQHGRLTLVNLLLVVEGAVEGDHDAVLPQRVDAPAQHETCQTVGSTTLLGVLLGRQHCLKDLVKVL